MLPMKIMEEKGEGKKRRQWTEEKAGDGHRPAFV
jgi:hypothetical protein